MKLNKILFKGKHQLTPTTITKIALPRATVKRKMKNKMVSSLVMEQANVPWTTIYRELPDTSKYTTERG